MPRQITRFTIRALDSIAKLLPQRKSEAQHLVTGRRGEEAAYFYLRKQGYVIVARNYRTPNSRSELDMIGWDDSTLCFIEVKTRTLRDELLPAESAVDFDKQRDLCRVAREFLRKNRKKEDPPFRFDIVTVYLEPGLDPQIAILKNAFAMV
ncbi:MAG TPA: YraN family protein [Candidatus Angelobacter sp.]|jgi:putative endonuclease|nr:YraN family protein [Candidatus Angelobacter sp.]